MDMPKKIQPSIVAEIERIYFEEGLPSYKVAEQLGLRRKTVLKYLNKSGRELRPAGWPKGRKGGWRLGYVNPATRATEHPTLLDIAWAAGIYEGEGCTSPRPYGFTVVVAQKEPWLCERLKALFGGNITYRVQHSSALSAGQPIHYWNIHGSRARGFVMTIYKFLSPRRQERIKEALAA